jgi:hypothetical protein
MGDKVKMTPREAGRRGGETTKERHGSEFYKDISTKAKEKIAKALKLLNEKENKE